ncbi:MAG: helix-turn-helix transcriptional regulator [Bacilli bacterium]|nr:helix-turn-helix transcriptional regulator [Bacilli bacterium]
MYSVLGEKVRLLRKRRGLKQDDLGELLDLSRSQISNLESGRRNLSLKQLEKLCEFFKIDISYFLMSETTDSCLDLLEKAKLLFKSKELSTVQKDDLFTSIMKIYLDSKDK